jgi:hypothetical protein
LISFSLSIASQIKRRPSSDFMESLQQDINKSMRGILIDWLVEVSFDCVEYIAALQAQHTPARNNLVITYLSMYHSSFAGCRGVQASA